MNQSAASPKSEVPPSLGEVLDFMRLIWAVDHALERRSKHTEATIGLTGPQRLVLRIVGRFPSISAGRLAKILLLHPSTLTGVLQRLEGERIIRRRADPRDRRRSLVGLTARGRSLDVETEGTVEAAVRSLLEQWSPTTTDVAREVLGALARALEPTPLGEEQGRPAKRRVRRAVHRARRA